jgi:nucleotide-binding universal stress UspA family protein
MAQDTENSATPHLETTRIRFHNILAATDFSEQATTALKLAARIAKLFHSKLQVVYAAMPEFYLGDTTMLSAELQKIEIERGQQRLHEYTAKIPEVRTALHEEIVLCGTPSEVITALVETEEIDLLVMGTHGRHSVGKMLMGSVAESVIRRTHCPVLVTGPQCKVHSQPLKSILLATDLLAVSLRAAQYATSLTRQFGGTLTVAHVLPEHDKKAKTSSEAEENLARKHLHELEPSNPEFRKHVHIRVRSGETAQEILRIANDGKADLIVMGAHERAVLADRAPWATLSLVIRESACPVLAVQPHIA